MGLEAYACSGHSHDHSRDHGARSRVHYYGVRFRDDRRNNGRARVLVSDGYAYFLNVGNILTKAP